MFSRIPVIMPHFRGDNVLYKNKYGYHIGTILHNIELFNQTPLQEKYDAFTGLYLFSIISVHLDLIEKPKIHNAINFKNKIYIITNTIIHNPIIQKLGVLYLEIKLLKESNVEFNEKYNQYKNYDYFLNILDDIIVYLIHIILSYNYKIIKDYIKSYNIYEIPKLYDTINLELEIDLVFILSKINDNMNDNFYCFDPVIEFNEFGREIIPEHHEIFYGYNSIIRNFRKFNEIKEIDKNLSEHTIKIISNQHDPLKHIKDYLIF